MGASEHPFRSLPVVEAGGELRELLARDRPPHRVGQTSSPVVAPCLAPATARLHGFDLQETPLLAGLPGREDELAAARSTVALRAEMMGAQVLVLFENGDAMRPIVIGVIQQAAGASLPGRQVMAEATATQVCADGERLVFSAEREIVLRCGEASITLTRAGKVVIRGNYVLSRSSGYNKIKGATVDIN